MQIDRSVVIAELEKQGKSEHVQKALQELPEKIDHQQHAEQLEKHGIDPGKLVAGGIEKELGRL
jgi:mannitol/fructose-specific phosphotransferase system IIA component (Ntr-type)